ncbi:MAG: Heat repeat-containing PBS lyase [Parcubacteria group bacterium Gr01-1014_106]|nr:MAG: Heat repeat-containing PBS lyase [Parcubacteria group bacterium Gr01-1014_106]
MTIKEFLNIKNPALRRQTIFALSRENSQESFALLCAILKKDASPVIRHEAVFLLGTSRNRKAVPKLISAILRDPSDLVRHEAIEALGDLHVKTKRIKDLLLTLQKDKNPFIKDTAEVALATLLKN